jgi:hypothetical protein
MSRITHLHVKRRQKRMRFRVCEGKTPFFSKNLRLSTSAQKWPQHVPTSISVPIGREIILLYKYEKMKHERPRRKKLLSVQ